MNYHFKPGQEINPAIIDKVWTCVLRKEHEYPGFAVLSFSEDLGSSSLRKNMIALKHGLSERCKKEFGEALDYCWLTRFDQQTNTKFHRDNAPADSFLLLGYEPTQVESKLLVADYHQFITENDVSVEKYYEDYNPMFKAGEKKLEPYITEVDDFDRKRYRIVIINNSDLSSKKTLGVLHKAEMITKDLSQARVVNSMMLYLKPKNEPESGEDERAFIETDEINT